MKRLLTGTLALFALLACGPEGSTTPPPFGVPISTTPGAGSGGGSGAMTPQARKGEACSTDADCGSSVLSCHLISGYDRGICAESCATSSGADPSLCRAPDVCSVTGLAICLQSCAADSDCAASAKCIEGSAPGRPDLVRVCVPREFLTPSQIDPSPQPEPEPSPAPSAEGIWKAQKFALDVAEELDSRQGTWTLDWLRLAGRTAGSPVTTGLMTEQADGTWRYATASSRLTFTRANGQTFVFLVGRLAGDYRATGFPSVGQTLDVTAEWSSALIHRIVYSAEQEYGYTETRRLEYSGAFTAANGTSFTADVTVKRRSAVVPADTYGTLSYRETWVDGAVETGASRATIHATRLFSLCINCYSHPSELDRRDVAATVGGGPTTLSYVYQRELRPQVNPLPVYTWEGTAKRNNVSVGSMTKRTPAYQQFTLDFTLDGQTYVVESGTGY